jgi:hypothetical protein
MMRKTPYNITDLFIAYEIISKGYEKIPKKSEGGLYSDELVDVVHLMMDLVLFYFTCIYIYNILILLLLLLLLL